MEDLDSVRTKEGRDKLDNWLMGELIPAGDIGTRMMIVGNLLHNDSVIKRLEKRMEEKKMNGVYFQFPIIDENGNPTWPGKYPNLEAVMAEKLKGLSEIAWNREYLLKIVPEEDQIIKEEYINYYDTLPFPLSSRDYRGAMTSVDLAISQAESADFTAVLSAYIHGYGKDRKIYLIPNPVNKKMSSIESANCVSSISRSLGNGIPTRVIVEDVGYQRAFIDLLNEREIPAEGVPIAGHDKTSRLMTTAPLIQQGQILFPKKGCELLITQLIGFGVEKHDDLMDALTLLVLKLMKDDGNIGRITIPTKPYDPEPLSDPLTVAEFYAIMRSDIERGMNPKQAERKMYDSYQKQKRKEDLNGPEYQELKKTTMWK
jgi:predicted phage terminase large subunit-like protein